MGEETAKTPRPHETQKNGIGFYLSDEPLRVSLMRRDESEAASTHHEDY
jgi:hypothetical protein